MNAAWLSGEVSDLDPLNELPRGGKYLNFTLTETSPRGESTTVRVSAYGEVAETASQILRNGYAAHVMGQIRSAARTGRVTIVARQIAIEASSIDRG